MSRTIKALGEIALRVRDLDRSERFYTDVVGLELLRRFERSAFFRIAEGHAGHTAVLALFDREASLEPARTTIDHIAFTIDLSDFESERARLESLGLNVQTTTHDWVHWRSLYVKDPDENVVELVCFDESV